MNTNDGARGSNQVTRVRFFDENGTRIAGSGVRAGMLITETDYDLGSHELTVTVMRPHEDGPIAAVNEWLTGGRGA